MSCSSDGVVGGVGASKDRGAKKERKKDIWDVEGGYMGVKKQKLLEQYSEQANSELCEGNIFRGVAIFVNGWTNPGSDELKRIMMTHGGVFHHYQSHATTHIIASNLPDVKVRALKGDEKIVKPEWITDSVKSGKLLDYSQYLLYTHQNKTQPRINFKQVLSTSNDVISGSVNVKPTTDANKENDNSRWVAKDATDSRFLGEFFNNSRLHHIATMGANAKDYVSSLRANHKGTFTARDNLQEITNTCQDTISRTIMHIDMDCFFVSVGLVSRPELKGKPVVVTHARGNKQSQGQLQDTLAAERRQAELSKYQERLGDKSSSWKLDNIDGTSSMSEIASCSYEARAKGVKNGMFLGPALKLCPDLVPISYDFVGYEKVSRVLYDTVASYTLDIMAVSCDEMFVDLTSLCKDLHMDPLSFVGQLRQEIFDKTGCCCSVGLGPNILLSRLATKKAKPNGQFLLTEESSGELLATMKVSELPGVGRSMGHKLSNLGVTIVGDLLKVSMTKLQQEFGQKTGSGLYKMARGQDDRQLELDHVRKTVSAEVNYGIRFKNWDDAEKFLQQLCDEVSRRLKKLSLVGRNLTLKLMMRAADAPEETSKYNGHGVCDNISRSVQLSFPTSKSEIFYKEVMSLVKLCNALPQDMRGLGITVSKLEQENSMKSSENSSILKFVKPKTGNTKINEKKSDSLHSDTSKNENSFFSSPLRRNPFKVKASDSILPNQIDHNFLESLPDDIKEEVMNEYKLKSKVDSTFEHEKTRLDFDIIEQLPTDIKEEIESEYNLNLNKPSTSRGKSSDLQSSIFIENEDSIDSLLEAENFPSTSNCDMSFSQVDKNVLHELPQELQLELTKHFSSRKKRSALQSESITAFDQIMKNGPTKTSPLKTIGSKLGRKKGSTNKKPSTSTSPKKPIKKNIPKNNENLDLYDSNSVDMDVFNCLPDDIKNEIETQMKINENITSKDRSFDQEQEYEPDQDEEELDRPTNSETEDLYGIDDPLPTFFGKSTIEDIRPMLKAWIFSNKPPNIEDIELLLEFLSDLIKIWRIDFVQILLKCMHRNISKLEDDSDTDWKNTWNNLVTKVQNVMMSSYGSPLLITEKF